MKVHEQHRLLLKDEHIAPQLHIVEDNRIEAKSAIIQDWEDHPTNPGLPVDRSFVAPSKAPDIFGNRPEILDLERGEWFKFAFLFWLSDRHV